MGFIDKVFGNNEDYDYTSSMGLKIKHLDGNKTKYVLSGRLAKGCTVIVQNSDEVGRVMKISYKARFEDRNGSSYEDQNQVLSIPADAISDYSHEKNFLFGDTKSFIVDNHSKFYASGDVYVSPYNEYEARNYNLERNHSKDKYKIIKIKKQIIIFYFLFLIVLSLFQVLENLLALFHLYQQ